MAQYQTLLGEQVFCLGAPKDRETLGGRSEGRTEGGVKPRNKLRKKQKTSPAVTSGGKI